MNFSKYRFLTGRMSRKAYFLAIAILILFGLLNWCLWIYLTSKFEYRTSYPMAIICMIIRTIFLLPPTIVVITRRLKDADALESGLIILGILSALSIFFTYGALEALYRYEYVVTQQEINDMCGAGCGLEEEIQLNSLASFIVIPFWVTGMPGIFELIVAICIGIMPTSKTSSDNLS